jgi:hypothetical protein
MSLTRFMVAAAGLALAAIAACSTEEDTSSASGTGAQTSASSGVGGGCAGCMNGTACLPGNANDACGNGAQACQACQGEQVCADGQCLAVPACNPANCKGCCDGATCAKGDATNACGHDGSQCAQCGGGACKDGGAGLACVPPCGPATCAGCCRADGTCAEPSNAECGAQGAACAKCGTGTSCAAGVCASDACKATCDGCCKPDGTCVKDANEDTCGWGGSACKTCGANELCAGGGCVAQDCKATCKGCCAGAQCLEGASNTACGGAGDACHDCTPFGALKCVTWGQRHACFTEPSSTWNIVAVSGDAPPKDKNGDSWDAFGGLPDPYLELSFNSAYTSKTVSDTFNATFNEEPIGKAVAIGSFQSPAYDTALNYFVSLWDDDATFDDRMFYCLVTLKFDSAPHRADDLLSGKIQQCSAGGGTARYRFKKP